MVSGLLNSDSLDERGASSRPAVTILLTKLLVSVRMRLQIYYIDPELRNWPSSLVLWDSFSLVSPEGVDRIVGEVRPTTSTFAQPG